jgi:hypothetical protein
LLKIELSFIAQQASKENILTKYYSSILATTLLKKIYKLANLVPTMPAAMTLVKPSFSSLSRMKVRKD